MKFLYSAFFLLTYSFVFSQNLGYKKNIYEWPDKKPDILQATEVFASEDLVVINEHVKINVIDRYAQTLTKNCIIKINNENGLKKISTFTLPESFDLAADKYFPLQGRDSKTLIPNAKNIRIKSTYKSNTFPFKHSFNCSEDIILNTGNEIQLANWFSFPFNKSDINQLPNFDYYFDFRYI